MEQEEKSGDQKKEKERSEEKIEERDGDGADV